MEEAATGAPGRCDGATHWRHATDSDTVWPQRAMVVRSPWTFRQRSPNLCSTGGLPLMERSLAMYIGGGVLLIIIILILIFVVF